MAHSTFLGEKGVADRGDGSVAIAEAQIGTLAGTEPTSGLVTQVKDIKHLLDVWSPACQLYIAGNVGLAVAELSVLAAALIAHTNWTVFISEKSEGNRYNSPNGSMHDGVEAIDRGLSEGLRSREIYRTPAEGLEITEKRNILYVTLDSDPNIGYLSGAAYDAASVGESRWVGDFDQAAHKALKSGRLCDAILDSVKVIDREYIENLALERQVVQEPDNSSSSSSQRRLVFRNLVLGGSDGLAAATGLQSETGSSVWLKAQRQRRGGSRGRTRRVVLGIEGIEARFANAEQSLNEISVAGISPYEGLTKTEIDDLMQLARQGASACMELSMKRAVASTSGESARILSVGAESKGWERYRAEKNGDLTSEQNLTHRIESLESRIDILKRELVEPVALREEIDEQLKSLFLQVLNPRLSEKVAREAGELRNSFTYAKDTEGRNDPVGHRRSLEQIAERIIELSDAVDQEAAAFESLAQAIIRSHKVLSRQFRKLERLERNALDLEKAGQLRKDYEKRIRNFSVVQREVLQGTDSSWLEHHATFTDILSDLSQPTRPSAGYHAAASESGGYFPTR